MCDQGVRSNAAWGNWPFFITNDAYTLAVDVTAAGALKVDGSAVTQPVSGTVTSSGVGRSTNPANVGDGSGVALYLDRAGRIISMGEAPRELRTTGSISLTTAAETTLIAAGAAGVFHDLTSLLITTDDTVLANNSILIRDATAGTVIMTIRLNGTASPIIIPFPVSIGQTTAANNWTVQLSAATTIGRTVSIFASVVKH